MGLDLRETEFLHSLVESVNFPRREAANPLDNSYFANLIRGSIKGLTEVARGTLTDWQLTAIVKLLQSWLEDKEAEQTLADSPSSWNYEYNQLRQYSRGDSGDRGSVDKHQEEV
jgi:hypothetical protein